VALVNPRVTVDALLDLYDVAGLIGRHDLLGSRVVVGRSTRFVGGVWGGVCNGVEKVFNVFVTIWWLGRNYWGVH
ncbi:hypothetical protein AAGG49_22310, partial [Stenotrophomonas maltophilia]|uniref:hypothetical protein n=1 Tax=Stenotrophomonas maltophilia TaxID=40324 RepID=UPI00313D8662